jgi:hypothetical protein
MPIDRTRRTNISTREFKISFVRGMSETSGVIRTDGRVANVFGQPTGGFGMTHDD